MNRTRLIGKLAIVVGRVENDDYPLCDPCMLTESRDLGEILTDCGYRALVDDLNEAIGVLRSIVDDLQGITYIGDAVAFLARFPPDETNTHD